MGGLGGSGPRIDELDAEGVDFDNSSNGFTASNVQTAIEEVLELADKAVFTIPLVYNGTLSGTQFISYSNLTPNSPIVVPVNSVFTGFTYSNAISGADYTLEFRKNTTGGAAFFSVSKINTQFFAEELVTPEAFSAGDTISVKYIDNGTNSNDGVWVLTFKAVV